MLALEPCKFKKFHSLFLPSLLACIGIACNSTNHNNSPSALNQHKTWMDYGGGPDQSKYVVLDDIKKSNVDQLKVAWFYPTGDNNVYMFNPIIVDSMMYVLAKDNSLVALNATNGKEIWIHAHLQGITPRGINYWESKDRKDRRLLFEMNNYLQAIDATTGKSILSFGNNGLVDLREGLGRDPKTLTRAQSGTPGKVFENLILLGSSTGEDYMSTPGYLRAYDVVTGKLVWTFHTIPLPGEPGYETWPKDAYKYIGGVNTWGEISVDQKRGIAYYPVGSPTYDYYGADRIGSNLYGNCLLALDARTGKHLWHFQIVHHDLWDYDPAAAPQLITVNHDGEKVDAVALAGKNGFLYVFDRVTGKPLWPIVERSVPPSDVPGEQAWPTQPFPTVVPPFARQKMTAADLSPYFLTPQERADWKKKIDSMQTGLYTPLSAKRETLAIPGAVGGAGWGSTAGNPEQGIVYVRSIDWPSFYGKLERREPSDSNNGAPPALSQQVEGGQNIYMTNCQGCHGADRMGRVGPQLLDVRSRFNFDKFLRVVSAGKGEMPAFPQLDERKLRSLYRYLIVSSGVNANKPLNGKSLDDEPGEISGPVVASGGAPGGQKLREVIGPASKARPGMKGFGIPYPEGVNAPAVRYYIPFGWGLSYPYLISPPWSSIVAYDLNKGTIKWKVPIGEDSLAVAEGDKHTGLLRAQRNGMIVTSTGVLFCTAKDGKIYAFDADNGKELWAGKLPTGTQGIPSIYEINGRHYLVVCATTPLVWGRGDNNKRNPNSNIPVSQGGYVVYTLP